MTLAPPPRNRISFGGFDVGGLGVYLGGLLSACGGPLVLYERLKEQLDPKWAFAVMFAPVLLLILGWNGLDDDEDAFSRIVVKAGLVGAASLVALDVSLLLMGTGRELVAGLVGASSKGSSDLWLKFVGFVVGMYWAGAYVNGAASRGWLTGERSEVLARLAIEKRMRESGDPLRPHRLPGPGARDGVLFGVLLALLGLAVLAFPNKPRAAISGIVFLGGGAIWAGANLVRKWREARTNPEPLALLGGYRYKPSRTRVGLFGAGLLVGSGVVLWFAADAPLVFRVLCAFVTLVGGVLFFGVLVGRLPASFFAVEPLGIRVGERSREYLFPWDSVVSLLPGELHDNPALFISVADLEVVEVSPPEQREKGLRRLANTRNGWGVDYMLLTSIYGFHLPSLIAALNRYCLVPTARAELDSTKLQGTPSEKILLR